MSNLIPVEFKNKRIMTTKVMAEQFGTEETNISKNFTRNEDRFISGKHFIKLEGDELREFKTTHLKDDSSMLRVNCLYLWTEQGAARHAKILDTDEAWEVFERLEDTYFRVRENQPQIQNLSPQLQLLINMEIEQKKLQQAVSKTNEEVQAIRDTIITIPDDWREWSNKTLKSIAYNKGIDYDKVRNESYGLLDGKGCDLEKRLKNRCTRARELGASESTIKKFNKLDCIGEDKKLVDMYLNIVKQMAIKYGIA
jgi:hypothetical protein